MNCSISPGYSERGHSPIEVRGGNRQGNRCPSGNGRCGFGEADGWRTVSYRLESNSTLGRQVCIISGVDIDTVGTRQGIEVTITRGSSRQTVDCSVPPRDVDSANSPVRVVRGDGQCNRG